MTMANAPLGDGTADDIDLIWVKREGGYFCRGGLDSANQIDPPQEFSLCAQRQGAQKLRKKLADGHIGLVRTKDCFVAFAFAAGDDETHVRLRSMRIPMNSVGDSGVMSATHSN